MALVEAKGGLEPHDPSSRHPLTGLPKASSPQSLMGGAVLDTCFMMGGPYALTPVSPGLGPGTGSQQMLREFRHLNSMPRSSVTINDCNILSIYRTKDMNSSRIC